MLWPFFKRNHRNDEWRIDRSNRWPGAIRSRGQEINDYFHSDLELSDSMVSIPEVHSGDMVL